MPMKKIAIEHLSIILKPQNLHKRKAQQNQRTVSYAHSNMAIPTSGIPTRKLVPY